MRRALFALLLLVAVPAQAVQNGSFTATWTPATDPAEVYEFRWRHFAAPDWIALPRMQGSLGTMTVAFAALPATPTTDRWMCLDARQIEPVVGPWLSTTTIGAACNTVDIGTIVLPPPPPPVTPPQPPVVPPPATPPPPQPPQPPLDQRIGQLEDALRAGLADLAAVESQLAMIKSAVCQSKASAGSLAAKLQAALGGCK